MKVTHRFAFVKVSDITEQPFNPETRMEPERWTELIRDIKEVGIISPVLLVRDPSNPKRYLLADGHRRRRAAGLADLEEVPAVVLSGLTAAEAYRRQFITRRPTGNELLRIYLSEPEAVPIRVCADYDRWKKILGYKRLKEFAEKPYEASGYSLKTAVAVDRYLCRALAPSSSEKYQRRSKDDRLREIAEWIVTCKQVGAANRFISVLKGQGSDLLDHIQQNVQLPTGRVRSKRKV